MQIAFTRLQGESGHAAGRKLLTALCGGDLPEIAQTKQGKPYFPNSTLHFSVSHTKNHAFCCLSEKNVGIDAEETDRTVSPALANKVFSETEIT